MRSHTVSRLTAAGPARHAVMVDRTCLLDDAAMRRFIVDGYLQVQARLPASFHARIRDRIGAVLARNGNPGDDILPHVPEIGQVFEAPAVRGALTSLLGPDYAIHPHRHCHDLGPGADGQEVVTVSGWRGRPGRRLPRA